jgi:hypothetical protein
MRARAGHLSAGALLSVVDDPVYGRFQRLARRFLSPRLAPDWDPGHPDRDCPAPVRPSFELYELWTFLELQRLLAARLPGVAWSGVGLEHVRSLTGSGAGARWVGRWPGRGTLTVRFNQTFRGYLSRGGAGGEGPYSISGERRPDLVVTWDPDPDNQASAPAWVCLDAKYRVTREHLGDAFASAHIYRDALRWEAYGGRCRGAVLVAPAMVEDCAPWFSPTFRQREGVGVIRLTPGRAESVVAEWMVEAVGAG